MLCKVVEIEVTAMGRLERFSNVIININFLIIFLYVDEVMLIFKFFRFDRYDEMKVTSAPTEPKMESARVIFS